MENKNDFGLMEKGCNYMVLSGHICMECGKLHTLDPKKELFGFLRESTKEDPHGT